MLFAIRLEVSKATSMNSEYIILITNSLNSARKCYMQVHPSGNYISTVLSSPNYTSPPFSQHILWQCCNHPDIPSFTVEILLFNLVFHNGVTSVSVSTLKPQAFPILSVCI